MIIRHVRASDIEQMFDCFREAAIRTADLTNPRAQKSGFFEYPLTFKQFRARAESPLTLVGVRNGRIITYAISYSLKEAKALQQRGMSDPVLDSLSDLDNSVIYHDQLYLQPGLPIYVGARMLHTATTQAQNEDSPGVIGATPQKPWKNVSATRLLAYHGFKRIGLVEEGLVSLGLFVKPFWHLDTPFKSWGDHLVTKN
jgi:hypothetical protein